MNPTGKVSNWLGPLKNASLSSKLNNAFSPIRKLSPKTRWITGAVIVLAIAGAFAYYRLVYLPAQTAAEPALQTSVVRQGSLVISASGTGTLISKNEVNLAFRTAGEVTDVYVKVGDQVKEGDVLAKLDDTDLKVKYAQAKRALQDLTSPSAVAEAKAGIATAESDLTSAIQHLAYIISPNVLHWENEAQKAQETLSQAQAKADAAPSDNDAQTALIIAKAGLEHAQAGLKGAQYSYKETYLKNNFTVTKMDQSTHQMVKYVADPSEADILEARAAVTTAEAAVTEANYYLTALTGGEIPDDATGDSLTKLEQAKLDVEDAKTQLDGASVVATIPGTVMSVDTSVGDSVTSGSSVMTVSDLSHPYLEVFLDESDWSNVKIDAEADVTFDILPDQTFTGKVTQVDPGLYTQGNSSVVRAYVEISDIDPTQFNMPLGTSASVEVIGAKAENALLIPVEALHQAGEGQYAVFIMENGKPRLRTVEIGIQDLVNVVVTSGLKAGDVVSTGLTETK
jgi:HlyD family secretion protein